MGAYGFVPGVRLVWQDAEWIVIRTIGAGQVVLEQLGTRAAQTVLRTTLEAAFTHRMLLFSGAPSSWTELNAQVPSLAIPARRISGRWEDQWEAMGSAPGNRFPASDTRDRTDVSPVFADYPEQLQMTALWRLYVIWPLLPLSRRQRTRRAVRDRVAAVRWARSRSSTGAIRSERLAGAPDMTSRDIPHDAVASHGIDLQDLQDLQDLHDLQDPQPRHDMLALAAKQGVPARVAEALSAWFGAPPLAMPATAPAHPDVAPLQTTDASVNLSGTVAPNPETHTDRQARTTDGASTPAMSTGPHTSTWRYPPSLEQAISVASAYRWLRTYEESGRDIRALVPATPARGGQGGSRLCDAQDAVLHTALGVRIANNRLTGRDVTREMARLQALAEARSALAELTELTELADVEAPREAPAPLQGAPGGCAPQDAAPPGAEQCADESVDIRSTLHTEGATHAARLAAAHSQAFPLPSLRTAQRRLATMREARYEAGVQRHLERQRAAAARSNSPFPRPPATRPLATVQGDHLLRVGLGLSDGYTNLLGWLVLTVLLDEATRYPLGYHLGFENPSYSVTAEALYHAILPKPDVREQWGTQNAWLGYGLMQRFKHDQGRDLMSRDLRAALLDLDILDQPGRVHYPEDRGMIERFFQETRKTIGQSVPTMSLRVLYRRKRSGAIDLAAAVETLEEFERQVNVFLIDVWAQALHRGIDLIPANRWNTFLDEGFVAPLPESAEWLARVLAARRTRRLNAYGVELEGFRYNSLEVQALRDRLHGAPEPVSVRFHPNDMGAIWVVDPLTNAYVLAPSMTPDVCAGRSLWACQLLRKLARMDAGAEDAASIGVALDSMRRGGAKRPRLSAPTLDQQRARLADSRARPSAVALGFSAPSAGSMDDDQHASFDTADAGATPATSPSGAATAPEERRGQPVVRAREHGWEVEYWPDDA